MLGSSDRGKGQMSTKSTIAHGLNFHLYHEALDEDYVYLELEGTKFEASYNRVMVPIPVHIWELIRRYPGIDLKYADKTDAELRLHVEREVDERLTHYEEANERSKGLVSLAGSLPFGTADQPRDIYPDIRGPTNCCRSRILHETARASTANKTGHQWLGTGKQQEIRTRIKLRPTRHWYRWLQAGDLSDRAIVATARHLRCPLITADEIIRDGDWVDTVWE